MTLVGLTAVKRFFRSPTTIVGELCFITLASVVGASLPQVGTASAADLARLRQHGPLLTALVDGLGLDHIFRGPVFLFALSLAAVSLAIVVQEQWRRLRTTWAQTPSEALFRTAPYQAEFLRPARGGTAGAIIRTTGRVGLAGSPLFHTGLLAVVLGATLSALFGVSAAIDLLEQETLPPTAAAWGAQWPGPLARPFQLEAPLTLEAVRLSWYDTGEVRDLGVQFTLAEAGRQVLGINQELPTAGGRLYVNSEVGPAALLEWTDGAGILHREALLLRQESPGAFTTQTNGALGFHVRTHLSAVEPRPTHLELRVTEGPALLYVGRLSPGDAIHLPGGRRVHLVALPFWARLHGTRDPALWLVYTGFALGLLGATLTYTVTRVDELVQVGPEDGQERVHLALRPHRFAPLFQDRFARLVRDHGGQP